MDNNPDMETREFMEEIANDMGYKHNDSHTRRRKASTGSKFSWKALVFGAAGIILIAILVSMFSGNNNNVSREELGSIFSRLDRLEEKILRLEGIEDNITRLEKQDKRILQSISKRKRTIKSNAALLKKLSQETDSLKRKLASATVKSVSPQAAQKKETSSGEKRYHKVRAGESLYGIAQQYGISIEDLCKINHISSKQVISPGQTLLVIPDGRK